MKPTTLFASIISVLLATAGEMRAAAVVSVNFTGGGFNGSPAISLLPGDFAGVVSANNYNNLPSALTGSPVALTDSGGGATGITLSITGSGLSYSSISGAGISPQGGDEKLNTGFLAGNNTLTLTGIPYAFYDIYIYVLNDNQTRVQTTTVNGVSIYHDSPNAASNVDQNISTAYNYIRATSTVSASPSVDTNYVQFAGLSGGTKTITIAAPVNGFVNGFQIVQVPEPGSGMLLCGVVLGAIGSGRRRRN